MENDKILPLAKRHYGSIGWVIFFGIIAILIGSCTYGLGTVTLVSSFFLGLFGAFTVNSITKSLLNDYSADEIFKPVERKKAYKKRFRATLAIGCIFAVATVAISVLTFGIGVIPLGTFAATAFTTAFGCIALSNFGNAYSFENNLNVLKECEVGDKITSPMNNQDSSQNFTDFSDNRINRPGVEEEEEQNEEQNFH